MPTPTIDLLEEMLTQGGEPKCTSRHDLNGDSCSLEVTHAFRAKCSGFHGLRCAVAANRIQRQIDTPTRGCSDCHRHLFKCWTLIPV